MTSTITKHHDRFILPAPLPIRGDTPHSSSVEAPEEAGISKPQRLCFAYVMRRVSKAVRDHARYQFEPLITRRQPSRPRYADVSTQLINHLLSLGSAAG